MPRKTAKNTMPDVIEGMKKAEAMKAKAEERAEAIAACVRGTLADLKAISEAARAEATAKGKKLKQRTPTAEDIGEVIPLEAWPVLFGMLKEATREAIREAISTGDRANLTKGQTLYFSLVENYIVAKTPLFSITKGGDYPQFAEACRPAAEVIAKIFGIEAGAMKKYCESIQKKIEEDNAQYFDAMKPTAEDVARRAAENIVEAGELAILNMLPVPQAQTHLVSNDKFDLFMSYTNGEASGLDLWKDENNVAFVKCTLPAGRIEPVDQEIERALSNLYQRYKDEHRDAGELGFTIEQIYCEMNGIQNTAHFNMSPNLYKRIQDGVEKLRRSEVELRAKDKNGVEFGERDFILSASCRWIKYPGCTKKIGYAVNKPGLLTKIETRLMNRLHVTPEQLNIGAGEHRVSITAISMTIRRILFREIFRISNTASVTPESRTISLATIIDYEAAPELVEYQDGKPIVQNKHHVAKIGATKKEQEAIRNARRHRREITGKILAHFVETGLITEFTPTAEGFIILVDKTNTAAKRILSADKRNKRINELTKAAEKKAARRKRK